jgi:hypothetical protein
VPADITTDVLAHVSVPPVALAPGGVFSSFTDAVVVLVQPFEPVTVTVYVPLAVTVGYWSDELNGPGPLQLKLVPLVVPAEITTDGFAQVNVPPDALAPGGAFSSFTTASAVLVQPFVPVTVTMYVPLAVTVGYAVPPFVMEPGPDQLNVVPPPAAESTTDVVVQVSVPPIVLAPGGVFCSSTNAVAVLAQPFEPVTVTVYVPLALTSTVALVLNPTMPGPAQLKLVPDVVVAEIVIDVLEQVSVPPVALAPGGEVLLMTSAVAVLVQPFEPVTVTVYVPAADVLGFALLELKPPGPDQLKLPPPAAEITTEVVVQVSVPPVALAPGGEVLLMTSAVAVLVQPFEPVTVTVYVPLAVTVGY